MDPNHFPVADSSPYHNALADCVEHWGLVAEKTELVRDGINHVFATETEEGEQVIVRISDGASRGKGELLGELTWLDHLNQHGCTVAEPIRSRGGELLESTHLDAGGYHTCCFKRFAGRAIDPATDPGWNDELLTNLGREVGRIHRASDALQLPAEQERKTWFEIDIEQFPDPLPEFYNRRVVDAMRSFLERMRSLPTAPRHFGLVHRDLHAGNFFVEAGQVQIFDFDLGCYCWRMIDLSVLLFGHYFFPCFRVPNSGPELAGKVLGALVRGYRTEYELDREQLEMVEDMIRLHAVLNYIAVLPAIEHWQVAMGDPHPTVAEAMTWMEETWLRGAAFRVDLSQL